MFGYTKKEALQLDIESISEGVSPFSQVEAAESIRKAACGEQHVFEWKAKKKNGELFWIEVNLKMIKLQGKDRVIAIVRDISARKQAEKYKNYLKVKREEKIFLLQFQNLRVPEPVQCCLYY